MITIFNLLGGFGGGPETNVYPQDAPTFSSPETLVAADAIRVEKTSTGQAYVNVLDFEWS